MMSIPLYTYFLLGSSHLSSLPMGAFLREYNHLQAVTICYVIYNIPVHGGHFKLLLCVAKNIVITRYTGEDHL